MKSRLKSVILVSSVLLPVSFDARTDEFDRSLLSGRWVELFGSERPNCNDAIIFEHELGDDGKTLTTHITRNWPFSELSGDRESVETNRVITVTRSAITFERDWGVDESTPTVWEIVYLSPDMYKLRADGWETDEGDFVRRQRCP